MVAEHPVLGTEVTENGIRLGATVKDIIYRGTVVDHVLALTDGQPLVVSATQRRVSETGTDVVVSLRAEHIVLLED